MNTSDVSAISPVALPELSPLVAEHAAALALAHEAAALERRLHDRALAAKRETDLRYQALYAIEHRLVDLAAERGLLPLPKGESVAMVAGGRIILLEQNGENVLAVVVPVVGVAEEGGDR
jgi:hypothetical protein